MSLLVRHELKKHFLLPFLCPGDIEIISPALPSLSICHTWMCWPDYAVKHMLFGTLFSLIFETLFLGNWKCLFLTLGILWRSWYYSITKKKWHLDFMTKLVLIQDSDSIQSKLCKIFFHKLRSSRLGGHAYSYAVFQVWFADIWVLWYSSQP